MHKIAKLPGKLHRTVLNRCLVALVTDLDVKAVSIYIRQNELFDDVIMRDILEQKTTTEKIEELIRRIQERDQETYEKFKDCLVQAKQAYLKDLLEKEEARVCNRTKEKHDTLDTASIEENIQWDSLRGKERRTFIDKTEQQRIIDLSQMILEQHRSHADKNFVETEGYRAANKIMQQDRRLIIAGKSGQGKSYMAHHLLNTIISENSDIKPLIISTVKQWKKLVDSSVTLGIIVDDMCGKFCLNKGELMKWREESTYMPALIENGKHVVIFTMKSFFYEKILAAMQSHPMFSRQISLNLDNIRLEFSEKNEFANTYLKRFGLNNIEISDLCEIQDSPVGFPQLCRAAEMIKEKSRLFDLFSKPREKILEQMRHIRQDDSMTYGCLALVLLSRGKLSLQSIREFGDGREKKKNIVMSVFRSCGIPDVTPIQVLNTLKSVQGTYLSFDATEKSYSFYHDSIEEAVFISHGEFFPEQTLRYCPLQLVCKRCTITDDESKVRETTPQDNTLILQSSYQPILINRFITALREGNPKDFTIVSEADVWSCRAFRKTFVAENKEIHFLADKDENSLLVHAAKVNNTDLVNELLHELDHIPDDKKKNVAQFLTKSAKASCAHKDTYLLEKICLNGCVDVNDILPHIIQHGSLDAIEFLLQSGADVNYRSKNGINLVHTACVHGRLDIVKLLHARNANLVNEFDNDHRSVSHFVAAGGSLEIMEFLLPLGLNPLYIDAHGWNPLNYACREAKKDMIEHLVDKYPKLLWSETKDGLTVLFCAACGGNIYIFKKLYELMEDSLKADMSENANRTNESTYLIRSTINQQTLLHMSCLGGSLEMTKYLVETYPKMLHEVDKCQGTPAHYAAQGGNVAVLSYLIDRGTDPWCRNSGEETLLHRTCFAGNLEMTKYLVETYPKMLHEVDNSKRTPAHHAAQGGNVAVLSYLIDRGTDPRCRNSEEQTLLHLACFAGHLEMTKYLVETYPKMLHEVDKCKGTPAHHAAKTGNVAVLSFLIDRGTDPWCRNSEEQTLLHLACIKGDLEMTKYLVETYPKMLHEVDKGKGTPAHYAAQGGNVAVLSYLIDRGTHPWCRNSEEQTLLHLACFKGDLEMTKYLVETYPKMLHEVDKGKGTPAHYAAQGGNVAVLSYLIDRGTDPWCRNSGEETLLHRTCFAGNYEMTTYLVETYPKMLHEVDNSKRTPAHHAAQGCNVAVLCYLVDRGADPWCRTSEEETILHRACLTGHLEMTNYLVETYPKMLHEVDKRKLTPAHHAAQGGNVALLSYLIDRGTDPLCRNSGEKTLLHMACIKGDLEMTKYLVETCSKMLHEVDKGKETPAHYAAQGGNVAVLSYLMDRGTDPWCRNSDEETILHRACLTGHLEMTKYLVETYPKMLHEVNNSKKTPAHYAAQGGNVAVLRYLIDRGMDPWRRNSEEQTLLHTACINGNVEMTKYLVETYPKMLHDVDKSKGTPAHYAAQGGNVAVLSYLIDRGTDPWCRNSEEQTLLHMACIKGDLEMAKYLLETYPKMLHEVDKCKGTPAHYAAQDSNVSVLNYLIDRGTDPWCRNSEEQTLLHMACIKGDLEMAKYLLETYPKMLHEVDKCKQTPAHYAAQGGNVAVLSYLIDCGTDPWCRNSEEHTLLHMACFKGHIEMTTYLVGAYPKMLHEVDKCKQIPAQYAAQGGNVAVLSYLIDRGTDPWCRHSEEQTLLHMACTKGDLETTKYLIETYPKMLHEVDKCKQTPAHYAAQGGNVSLLSYLIDRGTDPWCRNSEEQTLLNMACIKGDLEMTKYLVETYPKMLHQVDKCKGTPAHHAAQGGNVAVLIYLIDRGTDPWCRTSEEETILHRTCIKGDLEMTKYLVETYPKMLHEVDNIKRTPAHHAAHGGNVALLSYLIDRGTDPWCRNSKEQTLLHMACFAGHLEMTKYLVETYPKMLHEVDYFKQTPAHHATQGGNVALLSYLIDRGTDPWCRNSEEQTLLHIACFKGDLKMTKYLVETYPKMLYEVDNRKITPAHLAAHGGTEAVLSYLIDRGTDPWCRNSEEETILHRTCIEGHLKMTKYLVETYPQMLHQVDKCNGTPAHHAAQGGNVAVLSYLIDRGTDPWCRTSEEETILHRTCIKGDLEMTKYLVETYPKMLHQVDKCKRTPAHYAAHGGNFAVLSYLIDCGTDPWCRNSEEQTLLHLACRKGHLEMTKYFVETYPKMLHEVDTCKQTPAHYAAQGGNVAVLSYLIDRGTDPWCRNSEEQTLLHISCFKGHLEMTKYLVETYPKMLHEVDKCKQIPAHYASQGGNVAVLSYLNDRGTDPWCRNFEELTLLHISCFKGHLEMTKYLVETYPKMLHEVDKCKRTPVHYAAQGGNVAVLSYLIDRGTDPWCRNSEEQTLLHLACFKGDLEMTNYLVETYPKMLHEVDKCKQTPAHYAAQGGNVAVLSYLIDRGTDPWCRNSVEGTLLHRTCLAGKLETTKYLVETYPKMLHEVDNSKRTPAHYAAQGGNVAVLSYLIDRGTDPWCRNSEEQTLLHMACIKGDLEMTKYLVERYSKMLHEVDKCKGTTANYAAEGGHLAVLSYLIDRGIDLWCRNSEEQTLLHIACFKGHLEMTKYLVQTYPKMLHEVDKCQRTPAHYAAHGGNVAVLSYLIDRGTDPWCRNSEEQTLLHIVCLKGHLEMTKYLVETYPKMLHEVDKCKQTPAHYAAQGGHVAVLSYLIDRGTDPWCRNSEEQTLLHISCFKGHLEMTKYLVETYPKMLHEVDKCKRKPSHYAAHNTAASSYLIDRGTDPRIEPMKKSRFCTLV